MDLLDLINLPEIKVTEVSKTKYNEVYITIETTEQSTDCQLCGKELTTRHACDKERKLKHLPVFGRPTYIIYNPHRYICEDCDKQHRLGITRIVPIRLTGRQYIILELTQIFNTHMGKPAAIKKLNECIQEVRRSKLTYFESFMKILRKYKNEISNYFIARNTSAFVEGINNKTKVLKCRCYGIFNIKHLFQRLHLDISGYRLFGLVPVS